MRAMSSRIGLIAAASPMTRWSPRNFAWVFAAFSCRQALMLSRSRPQVSMVFRPLRLFRWAAIAPRSSKARWSAGSSVP